MYIAILFTFTHLLTFTHFQITCWNHVSRGEYLRTQVALHPVTNIRLEKDGAMVRTPFEIAFRVDSGTDATYTLWFNGGSLHSYASGEKICAFTI